MKKTHRLKTKRLKSSGTGWLGATKKRQSNIKHRLTAQFKVANLSWVKFGHPTTEHWAANLRNRMGATKKNPKTFAAQCDEFISFDVVNGDTFVDSVVVVDDDVLVVAAESNKQAVVSTESKAPIYFSAMMF